jgi:hypothetical protein
MIYQLLHMQAHTQVALHAGTQCSTESDILCITVSSCFQIVNPLLQTAAFLNI